MQKSGGKTERVRWGSDERSQGTVRELPAVQDRKMAGAGPIYVPQVDICESRESVRIVANMPGIDPNTVDVTVDDHVLTLEGRPVVELPKGYELAGQEFVVGRFRRDFALSEQVDVEAIRARVRQGVLDVVIPKKEEVKTRKIQVGS